MAGLKCPGRRPLLRLERLESTVSLVYLGSRTIERGQRAVDEIGGNARLLVFDVTDAASIAAAAAQVEELDVLVNNAGVMIDGNAATEADVDSFRRTYETNVFGVLAVTNAFLPALRRSAHPRTVNISSGTGSFGWSTGPNPQFAYTAPTPRLPQDWRVWDPRRCLWSLTMH